MYSLSGDFKRGRKTRYSGASLPFRGMSGLAQRAHARAGGPQRRRLALLVGACLAALLVVVLAAVASRSDDRVAAAPEVAAPTGEVQPGRPPLVAEPPARLVLAGAPPALRLRRLEEAVRADPADIDAALALAALQLDRGGRAAARRSLAAAAHVDARDLRPAAALALVDYRPATAAATISRLRALVANARDARTQAFVRFSLALAELWAGHRGEAERNLRAVRGAAPESFFGVAADDLLHPGMAPGYPAYFPSFTASRTDLPGLSADASRRPGDVRAQLAYGAALVRAGRRAEAVRVLSRAATLAPDNAEPRVALAVARFAKDDPSASVGVLGPLVRDRPDDPVPRFHLGLLLSWLRQREQARAQFAQVARTAPGTPLGRLARELAAGLAPGAG